MIWRVSPDHVSAHGTAEARSSKASEGVTATFLYINHSAIDTSSNPHHPCVGSAGQSLLPPLGPRTAMEAAEARSKGSTPPPFDRSTAPCSTASRCAHTGGSAGRGAHCMTPPTLAWPSCLQREGGGRAAVSGCQRRVARRRAVEEPGRKLVAQDVARRPVECGEGHGARRDGGGQPPARLDVGSGRDREDGGSCVRNTTASGAPAHLR